MKVITSEHVISGFHPLRLSEAIHQLLSIGYNLTHSLSLGPGLYIFLHLHRPEADIISLLEEACYDENGLSDTLDIAHTAKPSQFKHEVQLMPCSPLYFPLIISIIISL